MNASVTAARGRSDLGTELVRAKVAGGDAQRPPAHGDAHGQRVKLLRVQRSLEQTVGGKVEVVEILEREVQPCAQAAEDLEKLTVDVTMSEGSLRVAAGEFRTDEFRAQVAVTPGGCIDLCTLLQRLVDTVSLEEATDSFTVVMVKRGQGAARE